MKLRNGAGRENITVLGMYSTFGIVLDPLIIFKNMQVSWIGDQPLRNTFYDKSENGKYILSIAITILLMIDGVLKKCNNNNVIVIRLDGHRYPYTMV